VLDLPSKIQKLAAVVRENGGRALLVGGCVRDFLMNVAPKDFDVEVYGIEPARLREILRRFGRVDAVGEAFTVYKIGQNLDVSLPRRERKTGRGHRGFAIEGDSQMSFAEACRRRDFTINAILQDPLSGEIIDPFDGQKDIKNRLLRAVAPETFVEDSLRVLRAAQFAARFEFAIEPATVALCRRIDLSDLPKERIWGELEKLLLKAEKPSIGLRWIYELKIAEKLFPELQNLVGVPQQPEWHPEGDVDAHTLLTVDVARSLIDDLPRAKKIAVMLGALCHDFGKPATTRKLAGVWRSLGHDEAGVAPTVSFLDRLGVFKIDGYDVRGQIVELVRNHLRPSEFYRSRNSITDGAFRRLARCVELDLLYRVAKADSLGRNAAHLPREQWKTAEAQEWFINKVRELKIENAAPAPLLLGRHLIELGLEPSPRFGEILRTVYEKQLDGEITTLEEARAAAKSHLHKKNS
jgi:tRNA nucleotidyltransferase (CCA-adding enzyme)